MVLSIKLDGNLLGGEPNQSGTNILPATFEKYTEDSLKVILKFLDIMQG